MHFILLHFLVDWILWSGFVFCFCSKKGLWMTFRLSSTMCKNGFRAPLCLNTDLAYGGRSLSHTSFPLDQGGCCLSTWLHCPLALNIAWTRNEGRLLLIPFPGGDRECVRSHSLSLKLNNLHGYVSELICLSVISTFPGFVVPFHCVCVGISLIQHFLL